jgi:hypothetical protein
VLGRVVGVGAGGGVNNVVCTDENSGIDSREYVLRWASGC